jgi:hypothetical protein
MRHWLSTRAPAEIRCVPARGCGNPEPVDTVLLFVGVGVVAFVAVYLAGRTMYVAKTAEYSIFSKIRLFRWFTVADEGVEPPSVELTRSDERGRSERDDS